MAAYFKLNIVDDLALVVPEYNMATEVYELIMSDLPHLDPFLGFKEIVTDVKSEADYIKLKFQGLVANTDRLFFITKQDKIIGTVDLHNMQMDDKTAEIGYWLHSSYTQQGIMTKAVHTLINYAFENLQLNKVTIMADVANTASNKVAQRLDFTWLGMRPQDKVMHHEMHDMNEYYLLRQDFK